jgi:hypothetical protein
MANTPDAHAFDVVSEPLSSNSQEFRDIAHAAASIDTLDGFLRDMNSRYPQSGDGPPPQGAAAPAASADPTAAAGPVSTKGAAEPAPAPPARAAGRTASR